LLRWPQSTGGFISPVEFIAAAEDSGLIHDVGFWVLEETCHWLDRWSVGRKDVPRLALNISAIQFRQPGFSERLIDAVGAAGVDPAGLELEITESCLLDDAEAIVSQLHEFRRRGMRTALDDFGTGYSSLGRLRRLPIDTLKIDRSFVSDICDSADSHTIAETIVRMGHLMSKEVVAEGVETTEQAAILRAIGCEFGQGYLFSPAVPPEAFARFLT
jgi:EAL domain-containing protein (putative c-di-GMP-specific phosphodiesterase class I)